MQIIKIVPTQVPDKESNRTIRKFYGVYVNHATLYFKSERRMMLWIGQLNEHLNIIAADVNILSIDVFTEYRYYFFHFKSPERRKTDGEFRAIDKAFDLLLTRTESPNYNSFAYQHLNTIINNMDSVLKRLHGHPMNKIATVQRHRIKTRMQRIDECRKRIQSFPKGYDQIEYFREDISYYEI